ncbi:MAG: hypothetical protein FWD86_03220, partial [Firmicutes bacterium]|nr:hypothetical protein [Bacillota bacterium]
MAEPLKNMLNKQALCEFAGAIKSVHDDFAADEFVKTAMADDYDGLELMARGRKIAQTLGDFLPSKYIDAIALIDKVVKIYQGFAAFSFTEFITIYGQADFHWDVSVAALGRI